MEINTKNKDKKISIGKLPAFLGDRLLELEQSTTIGEMVLGDDSNSEKITFNINEFFSDIEDFPLEFNVKKITRGNNMYVINSNANETIVEGEVESEYYITPKLTPCYLRYKRKQSQNKKKEVRNAEVIDYVSEGRRSEKIGSLRELEYLARKRKRMLLEKKRERLGKNEVLDIVFNAFEKYDSWTVKDLADFTGQPTAFIQEIVDEICVVNKKDHKNTYELKTEYK
ncbi:General transcription factor IIF subunit 2 [Nosema granulosis]|uniref:Transcription initiation factor IIF subunit beta n=1 Tax=Nosema granulosis TaxID=83296 RepID=A0A9P6KZE9_9MICR|nr:General transcription factor IIF subunit 2 [Nosema granulosis]